MRIVLVFQTTLTHPLTKSQRLEIQGAALDSVQDLKFMLGIPTMTADQKVILISQNDQQNCKNCAHFKKIKHFKNHNYQKIIRIKVLLLDGLLD